MHAKKIMNNCCYDVLALVEIKFASNEAYSIFKALKFKKFCVNEGRRLSGSI